MEDSMGELRQLIDDIEHGRHKSDWPPELVARAVAAECHMRESPISDEDAVKAAVAFITFTPLGGE